MGLKCKVVIETKLKTEKKKTNWRWINEDIIMHHSKLLICYGLIVIVTHEFLPHIYREVFC